MSIEDDERPRPEDDRRFNTTDALRLHHTPAKALSVSVQGSVLFIGNYWMGVDEARLLRDWLNRVLP